MNPNVYTNYGANEAGSFTVATPELLARDPDTGGRISPGIEFQVVAEVGRSADRLRRDAAPLGGDADDALFDVLGVFTVHAISR